MKRLTRVVSLRNTAELWGWIGAEPGRIKREWPGWEKHSERVIADCFLCEWVTQSPARTCHLCPLKSCLAQDSPFQDWQNLLAREDYPAAQQAAQLIARLCRDELARLGALPKKKKPYVLGTDAVVEVEW